MGLVAVLLVVLLLGAALAPQSARQRPQTPPRRVLLYDLQAAEGFNLRRDAMMRAAMIVLDLGPDWTLVLPPFHRMVHWTRDPGKALSPWRDFVDLSRLGEVAVRRRLPASQARAPYENRSLMSVQIARAPSIARIFLPSAIDRGV